MVSFLLRLASCLAILLLATTCAASDVQRFPPPDFTDHKLPETAVPAMHSIAWDYVDVAVFAAGLGLASYFALVRRWRHGLLGLAIVSLVWLGFWRKGCICPIGAIQNVTLAVFDPSYVVPASVVLIFVLPLVFSLFFGRTFCAAVCPLGAIQDVTLLRPIRVPAWLDHGLGLFPFVYLGLAIALAATGAGFVICEYDPFVNIFRLGGSASVLTFGGSVLLIGLFVGRPYCRYVCPLGAVFRVLSPLARWHVRIPPDDCINCRLCEDSCPYNAIRPPTVDPTTEDRLRGRRRLAVLLVLLPVLVIVGAVLGRWLGEPMSRLHPHVRLAEWVRAAELAGEARPAVAKGVADALEAFRNTGRPAAELYREAIALRGRFAVAGIWLGAWVGLVIGMKLIALSIRRRRTEYLPDRSGCVSCGRCFSYCPKEQVRLGLIPTVEVALAASGLDKKDPA